MTQTELARALEVRQATISEWETGTRRIRLGRIVELALWALQAGQVLALDQADDGLGLSYDSGHTDGYAEGMKDGRRQGRQWEREEHGDEDGAD